MTKFFGVVVVGVLVMRRKTKFKGSDSEGMKRLGLCGELVCFDGKAKLFFEIHRIGSGRRLVMSAQEEWSRTQFSVLPVGSPSWRGSLIETAGRRDCDSVKRLDWAGDCPLSLS